MVEVPSSNLGSPTNPPNVILLDVTEASFLFKEALHQYLGFHR